MALILSYRAAGPGSIGASACSGTPAPVGPARERDGDRESTNLNDYYSVQLKQDRIGRESRRAGGRFPVHPLRLFSPIIAALDTAALAGCGDRPDRPSSGGAGRGCAIRSIIRAAYVQSNLVGHLTTCLELARPPPPVKPPSSYASSSSGLLAANDSLPFRVEDRVDHPLSLYAATKKSRRADEARPMRISIGCRSPDCVSSPSMAHGGAPTWRCGCSPTRIPPGAADLGCSTAARCGETSPISMTSSPGRDRGARSPARR